MSIDLRTRKGGAGCWVGRPENDAFKINIGDDSAYITVKALGIEFCVDRTDVPAAWAKGDVNDVELLTQLKFTILRKMSMETIEELFEEFASQRRQATWDGQQIAKRRLREALGL